MPAGLRRATFAADLSDISLRCTARRALFSFVLSLSIRALCLVFLGAIFVVTPELHLVKSVTTADLRENKYVCERRVCSFGCPPFFEMHNAGRLKTIFKSLDRMLMTIWSQNAWFWLDLQ